MPEQQPQDAGRHAAPQAGPDTAPSSAPPDAGTEDAASEVLHGGAAPEPPDAVVAELEDRWRRTAADLDNMRKRHARELERERSAERRRVAAAFLPVLDNLELALAHAGSDPGAIVEGVRRVLGQGVAVLAGLGFERRDEVGVPFDPGRHEVVTVLDEPGVEPGTVLQVLRAGYGDGAGQLRPASVAVSRGAG